MSGPPPASSWAAPPEFYADENAVTRSVLRLLRGLGYVIHSPAELYGSRDGALGAADEDWLGRVGTRGWACLTRDLKIYERPAELAAYQRAPVHVFLLPGEATARQLTELIAACLADMCTVAVGRPPQTWKLTMAGVQPYKVANRGQRGR
jgi:PIN like domain